MLLDAKLKGSLLAVLVVFASTRADATPQVAFPGAARSPQPPPVAALHVLPHHGPGLGRLSRATVWIPGHEQQVIRQVWVEGARRLEWIPAVMATRFDPCGRPYTVIARAGHWRTVCEPGHYETQVERVWVPGRWRLAPR